MVMEYRAVQRQRLVCFHNYLCALLEVQLCKFTFLSYLNDEDSKRRRIGWGRLCSFSVVGCLCDCVNFEAKIREDQHMIVVLWYWQIWQFKLVYESWHSDGFILSLVIGAEAQGIPHQVWGHCRRQVHSAALQMSKSSRSVCHKQASCSRDGWFTLVRMKWNNYSSWSFLLTWLG